MRAVSLLLVAFVLGAHATDEEIRRNPSDLTVACKAVLVMEEPACIDWDWDQWEGKTAAEQGAALGELEDWAADLGGLTCLGKRGRC